MNGVSDHKRLGVEGLSGYGHTGCIICFRCSRVPHNEGYGFTAIAIAGVRALITIGGRSRLVDTTRAISHLTRAYVYGYLK